MEEDAKRKEKMTLHACRGMTTIKQDVTTTGPEILMPMPACCRDRRQRGWEMTSAKLHSTMPACSRDRRLRDWEMAKVKLDIPGPEPSWTER